MRAWILGLTLFAGLCAAGCGATSEHPLCDESDAVVDARLIGWWEGTAGEEGQQAPRLAVGRVKETRALEAVWMQVKNGHVRVTRIPFHTTKIGDKHYLNVALKSLKDLGEIDADKGNVFFRYSIEGDLMTLYTLDPKQVGAAIAAKEIAGEPAKNEADSPHLTATQNQLRAWLAKAPDSLWKAGDDKLRKVVVKDD